GRSSGGSRAASGGCRAATTAERPQTNPRKEGPMRRDDLPADGKPLLLGRLDFKNTEAQGWPVKRLFIRGCYLRMASVAQAGKPGPRSERYEVSSLWDRSELSGNTRDGPDDW